MKNNNMRLYLCTGTFNRPPPYKMKRINFHVFVKHIIPVMCGAFVVTGTGCSVSTKKIRDTIKLNKILKKDICWFLLQQIDTYFILF